MRFDSDTLKNKRRLLSTEHETSKELGREQQYGWSLPHQQIGKHLIRFDSIQFDSTQLQLGITCRISCGTAMDPWTPSLLRNTESRMQEFCLTTVFKGFMAVSQTRRNKGYREAKGVRAHDKKHQGVHNCDSNSNKST